MADSSLRGQKVPRRQPKPPTETPSTQRTFSGRFVPRIGTLSTPMPGGKSPKALPAVQPRRKPVLKNGVQR